MKKLLSGLVLLLTLGAGCTSKPEPVVREAVHYHAGFQIYVDDALQDFSAMEYMELAPCGPNDIREDDTVHLHNSVGDVVHVHHAGMTWNNLIMYLQDHQQFAPSNLSEKGIYGYVNGKKVDDIREYPITAYDSVVIIIGYELGETSEKLKNAVTVDAIKAAEAQKENCGV